MALCEKLLSLATNISTLFRHTTHLTSTSVCVGVRLNLILSILFLPANDCFLSNKVTDKCFGWLVSSSFNHHHCNCNFLSLFSFFITFSSSLFTLSFFRSLISFLSCFLTLSTSITFSNLSSLCLNFFLLSLFSCAEA